MVILWWFYGDFMVILWWFYGDFMVILMGFYGDFNRINGIYPLVMTNVAIEHGNWNSGFSH